VAKLIERLARGLASEERPVSRRDLITGGHARTGVALASVLATERAAVAWAEDSQARPGSDQVKRDPSAPTDRSHRFADPGAGQILAILSDAGPKLKQDTIQIARAGTVKPDGGIDTQRVLRDMENERNDLEDLRRHVAGVRCHTGAGRRGRALTILALEQTQAALLALSRAVVASDQTMIQTLSHRAKRLSEDAQHNGKRGLALLER
jgi:hypothetical protein